ncbi:VOC family protein [Sphingomonas crusticola]|uniref:VOC family protein n=1 Tax=Sphingomonas crusticola TaxID=1697973 RepID=UPI000E235CB6|nr:VOC family protein [Sphingomonas crusticola]
MTDNFVWYELCTNDLDGAQAFYERLLGWTCAPFGGSGSAETPEYRIFSMNGAGIAGLMPLPEGMTTPFWLGYVGVGDCDAATASAEAAGAHIHRTMEIPTVGKITLLSDPQGVGYAIIQGYSDRKSEAFAVGKPGHGNWHELYSPDPVAALDYYAGQYGWTRGMTMPMGAMGDYQLVQADGVDIGGMMRAPENVPPSWGYYFGVDAAADAIERAKANGGAVLNGPMEVPGPMYIAQLTDPQGAYVAVVGPR